MSRRVLNQTVSDDVIRAFIYVRISKDRVGAGLGVERQEGDCRDLAGMLSRQFGKQVVVVEVYVDNDMSAYSGKPRKQYLRMLGDLRVGRGELILAWHTDRLHRSPSELEEYIQVCQPRDVATHCVKAGHLDLTTPAGRLVARNLGAAARYEVEHMSERISAQKLRALTNGEWIGGGRPFGYAGPIQDAYGNVLNREEVGVKIIEHEAAMIKDAVQRVISGESLYAICRRWTASGVPTPCGSKRWLPATLRRILVRPRNVGLVAHRGVVLEGVKAVWPPIITEDEYHAVRAILLDTEHRTTYWGSRSLKWMGTNLYNCSVCQDLMRSSGEATYRCRQLNHLSVVADPVDAIVNTYVCARLAKHGADLIEVPSGDAMDLRAKANTLRARIVELEDMLGEGELSRPAFLRQRDKIMTKLDMVNADLASRSTSSVLSGVADAPNPAEVFMNPEKTPIERKRAIVDALCTVTILKGKKGRKPQHLVGDFRDRVLIENKEAA
ncbi:recombinase family protein [Amycolatopsis taiwanensis]|uniref:recombinase family protein n=1 Tax=Amycolatopsis taiwanensis TaxID=342230 RepID=UPI0004B619B3|nr:recombinase family protein [Amycolatopsis taiwanensis]